MRGFSLIEMLVIITILLLLLGGGIAAYIRFNEKQQLVGAARQLQVYLRSAQKKARVGDRPEACDRLQSYTVRVAAGTHEVLIEANCDNGDEVVDTYSIPTSISVDNNVEVNFRVLHGGAESAEVVELTGGDNTFRFEVTTGGEITDGEVVE